MGEGGTHLPTHKSLCPAGRNGIRQSAEKRGGVRMPVGFRLPSIPRGKCRGAAHAVFLAGNSRFPSVRPIETAKFPILSRFHRVSLEVGETPAGMAANRPLTILGGVLVSTGLQEVQIACRGWSAGHVKSRPRFNCRSTVCSGCLTKPPRAMAPVGRASQTVAKSDSPRFIAWHGRG